LRTTVYRRLDDADFCRRLSQLRGQIMGQAVGTLISTSTDAATTLRALLSAESESVRLGAARSILEPGSKFRESLELEERLARLENLLADKGRVEQ